MAFPQPKASTPQEFVRRFLQFSVAAGSPTPAALWLVKAIGTGSLSGQTAGERVVGIYFYDFDGCFDIISHQNSQIVIPTLAIGKSSEPASSTQTAPVLFSGGSQQPW